MNKQSSQQAWIERASEVLPADGFLQRLRELASKRGSVLIFDEVVTADDIARTEQAIKAAAEALGQ